MFLQKFILKLISSFSDACGNILTKIILILTNILFQFSFIVIHLFLIITPTINLTIIYIILNVCEERSPIYLQGTNTVWILTVIYILLRKFINFLTFSAQPEPLQLALEIAANYTHVLYSNRIYCLRFENN